MVKIVGTIKEVIVVIPYNYWKQNFSFFLGFVALWLTFFIWPATANLKNEILFWFGRIGIAICVSKLYDKIRSRYKRNPD